MITSVWLYPHIPLELHSLQCGSGLTRADTGTACCLALNHVMCLRVHHGKPVRTHMALTDVFSANAGESIHMEPDWPLKDGADGMSASSGFKSPQKVPLNGTAIDHTSNDHILMLTSLPRSLTSHISYLLLCSKLPQNLVTGNNRFLFSVSTVDKSEASGWFWLKISQEDAV